MEKEEPFERGNSREIVYFFNAVVADDFDVAIRKAAPDDDSDNHAKVELVFYQQKGNNKDEVVSAVRMQLFELEKLDALLRRKIKAFREKSD